MSDVPQAGRATRRNDDGLSDSAWGAGGKGAVVSDEATLDVVSVPTYEIERGMVQGSRGEHPSRSASTTMDSRRLSSRVKDD